MALALFAFSLWLNTRHNDFPYSYHPDEGGKPLHVQQAEQIRAFRKAWKEAGHTREPRASISRLASTRFWRVVRERLSIRMSRAGMPCFNA